MDVDVVVGQFEWGVGVYFFYFFDCVLQVEEWCDFYDVVDGDDKQ